MPFDQASDLAAHRLPVLAHEGDAGRLGLVHDVGRDDLEHDLIAGKARERFFGDHLFGGQEHVVRRGDGADQLHDRVDLVFEQLAPAFFMCERERAFDGVRFGARQPVFERDHVEHWSIRRFGGGQMLGAERIDPVPHGHRVSAAAEAVEVGLSGVTSEAECALVGADHVRALVLEHRHH